MGRNVIEQVTQVQLAGAQKLIQEIKTADEAAQILLFVQYAGIRKVIDKAFTAAKVSFATIAGAELKQTAGNKIMHSTSLERMNASVGTSWNIDGKSKIWHSAVTQYGPS